MNLKQYENVYEYYSHMNDNNPLNITAVGESFWCDNCFFERNSSQITAIEFVVNGNGVLENNGQKYYLGPKDVFLLRKGTNHKYYNAKNSTLHKFFITITGELAEILLDQYLSGHDYVYHNCELEELFGEIYKKAGKVYGDNYSLFVDEMTPELIKLIVALRNYASTEHKDLAYLMREYLDSQIMQSFSLDDMCQKFGYSKNHIINKFSEKFDITPYQYYTAKKLETVKLYLINTKYTFSEIAKKMSFSDQQYFSSWFKSLCGMSPSKFRNSCGKENCDNSQ